MTQSRKTASAFKLQKLSKIIDDAKKKMSDTKGVTEMNAKQLSDCVSVAENIEGLSAIRSELWHAAEEFEKSVSKLSAAMAGLEKSGCFKNHFKYRNKFNAKVSGTDGEIAFKEFVKAIDIAGSQSKLADDLSIKKQSVSTMKANRCATPTVALSISKHGKYGDIKKELLRPDLTQEDWEFLESESKK